MDQGEANQPRPLAYVTDYLAQLQCDQCHSILVSIQHENPRISRVQSKSNLGLTLRENVHAAHLLANTCELTQAKVSEYKGVAGMLVDNSGANDQRLDSRGTLAIYNVPYMYKAFIMAFHVQLSYSL